MNFLIRPDAEALLREDDYRRLWQFFTSWGGAPWLTEERQAAIPRGLGRQPDRRLQLLPRLAAAAAARRRIRAPLAIDLPREMLTVDLPTLVLWAMDDAALPPELIDGLDEYVPRSDAGKGRRAPRTGSSTSGRSSWPSASATFLLK